MNTYKFLNCTKEVIFCLEEAKKIAILKDNSTTIKPLHLCLSLIFNSSLVQKILNIHKLNKSLILNSIFNSANNVTSNVNKTALKIDTNILEIINVLNMSKYPFNTLSLFYYIWKQNSSIYSFIFSILNIQNDKILSTLKPYIVNTSLTLKIPTALNPIITFIKKDKNIIGRDKEIEEIKEVLGRNLNRNIVLLGEEGIGKFSIVQKLSSIISNKIFLNLDIFNLIAFSNNTEIINKIFNFFHTNSNIVLYCKNIHLLFDSSSSELILIQNKFLELLNLNKIQLIGTSVRNLYEKIVDNFKILNFLVTKIFISETDKYTTMLILKQNITKNYKNKEFLITESILENIIDLSSKFIKNYLFPKKGLLILDSIFSKSKNLTKLTKKDILSTIVDYSELPKTLILKEENQEINIKNIELNLKNCVYGQDIAISKISASLKRAYIGLKDKNKPIGSWLFCGPSGTGKTELVKSLAKILFGSEKELIRFDMSEFMEKHSIAKLIGTPPGYVGYEEGGLLTEAVKKRPYSVVLFDEIEKAHKDVNNIMLQLLDEGMLTDSKGEHVDFTNTLIVYTSNLGCPTSSSQFNSFEQGLDLSEDEYKFLSKNVNIAVKNFFKPEFLNRLDSLIVFKPLSISCLMHITDKFISILSNKLKESDIFLNIEIEQEVKTLLAKISYNPLYGARPLKRTIEQFIEKPISELVLNYKFEKPHLFSIFIDKQKDTINYLIKKFTN